MSANDVNPWNEISSVSADEPVPPAYASRRRNEVDPAPEDIAAGMPAEPAAGTGSPAAPGVPTAPDAPVPESVPAAPGAAGHPSSPTPAGPSALPPLPQNDKGGHPASPDAPPNAEVNPLPAFPGTPVGSTPAGSPPGIGVAPSADAATPAGGSTAGGPVPPTWGAANPSGGAAPVPPTSPKAGKTPGSGLMACALGLSVISIFFSAFPIVTLPVAIIALVLAARAKCAGARHVMLTISRVCAVIGIIFSILTGAVWVFTTSLLLDNGMLSSTFLTGAEDDDPRDSNPSGDADTHLTADEIEVASVVEAELELIAQKDGKYLDILDEDLRAVFDEELGISPDDLGIDPNLYPNWMLIGFKYEIDSVFIDGDTATVYADITVRDPYELIARWNELAGEIPDSAGEIETIEGLRQALMEAMSEEYEPQSTYIAVDLTLVDGEWTIDEDAWDEAVWQMLLF